MNTLSHRISTLRTRALLTVAAAALFGAAPLGAQAAQNNHGSAASRCSNCGTVVSTHTYQRAAEHGSGLGIATGAVVGGLLGNHVGGGNGRSLATVAGALGGGYAGNEIEKRSRTTTMTEVRVRMSNGAVRTFTESGASRRRAGQQVRVRNGSLR
ncbi:MAG: glycine zipper protein [Massilia sp.]|jgi:outer membrane lipoprotein SlyB|nr:glycine zipper protein [Massilia sp.]